MAMSPHARPPKRTRLERERSPERPASPLPPQEVSDPLVDGVKRDNEFWFKDGSVVIRARDTAFRLFQGLLCTQSPVLNSLFSAPRLTSDEQIDGVPVVRVFDAPEDWCHLLRVLIPQESALIPETLGTLKDFPIVSALIRLAHKYEMRNVERRAIDALKRMYPDHFESFLKVDAQVDYTNTSDGSGSGAGKSELLLATYAIGAVNLAHLTNTPSVLPVALYHCVCLGGAVVRGYVHEDGSVEVLGADDLSLCIDGVCRLTAALSDYVDAMQHPMSHSCRTPKVCKTRWNEKMNGMKNTWRRSVGSQTLRGAGRFYREMCETCLVLAAKRDVEGRRKVWARLPELLGVADVVGPWAVESR